MGQYYKAVILDEDGQVDKFVVPWDYDSGAKLMESAWLDNGFVQAVETLLTGDVGRRLVWAGDYADAEKDEDGNPMIVVSDNYSAGVGDANLYVLADISGLEPYRPDVPAYGRQTHYTWVYKSGPRKGERRQKPLIRHTRDTAGINAKPIVIPEMISDTLFTHPFIVNWDKQTYVDKRHVDPEPPEKPTIWNPTPSKDRWVIHPLPLLTVEGNGRGGGDFRHADPDGLIGSWARDHISLHTTLPAIAEGWEELKFNLHEVGEVSW